MAKPKVYKAKWNTAATSAEMEMCGVYKILNVNTGKFYIGSTGISFSHRWSQHVRRLNNKNHFNRHLSASWKKHGESAFVFSIVEITRPEWAAAYEQVFLDCWKPWDCKIGYNITKNAETSLGRRHTKEARKMISECAKLQFSNPEARKAASERQKKLRGTPEARKAQSERSKLQFSSPEYRRLHGEKIKACKSTPEAKKSQSERMKLLWANKEWKSSQAKKIKNAWAKKANTATEKNSKFQKSINATGDKNGKQT